VTDLDALQEFIAECRTTSAQGDHAFPSSRVLSFLARIAEDHTAATEQILEWKRSHAELCTEVLVLKARCAHVEMRAGEMLVERDRWIVQAHELGAEVMRLQETEHDLRATLNARSAP
jgi:hypothetical protein